jgi:HAD superfamily hydrolase (TIGR01509 family)
MQTQVKAVIFDMDGVLIDSEPLWRIAMVKGFTDIGVPFTEDDCRKTTGMRFKEVVEIWLNHFKITNISAAEFEKQVTENLTDLIQEKGKAIHGVLDILNYCTERQLKIGLATSSSVNLMKNVIQKLEIENFFDATISAEYMLYAKPHPEVYLTCANQLAVHPINCLVIEDSVNGCISGKAAQMKVIAVPDIDHKKDERFGIADFRYNNMVEALQGIKLII